MTKLRALAFTFFLLGASALADNLTFEGITNNGSVTTGTAMSSYLNAHGISLSGVTGGTSIIGVTNFGFYGGQALQATSGVMSLYQSGSNAPVSFTMNFASPVNSVTFNRPNLIAGPNGITFPYWRAYAFDVNGIQLGVVGENAFGSFSYVNAVTFSFSGNISYIRFDSINSGTAFSSVVIDDLRFTPDYQPVPEPASLVLLGTGLLAAGSRMKKFMHRSR